MSPILPKSDAAALVVTARIRRGLSWTQITDELGAPVVCAPPRCWVSTR